MRSTFFHWVRISKECCLVIYSQRWDSILQWAAVAPQQQQWTAKSSKWNNKLLLWIILTRRPISVRRVGPFFRDLTLHGSCRRFKVTPAALMAPYEQLHESFRYNKTSQAIGMFYINFISCYYAYSINLKLQCVCFDLKPNFLSSGGTSPIIQCNLIQDIILAKAFHRWLSKLFSMQELSSIIGTNKTLKASGFYWQLSDSLPTDKELWRLNYLIFKCSELTSDILPPCGKTQKQ